MNWYTVPSSHCRIPFGYIYIISPIGIFVNPFFKKLERFLMLSKRLKELRKEKGLTQKEIAQLLNIKQNSYSNWETGKKNPSQENLSQLAQILDTSTDYLLGNTPIKNFQELDIETVKDSLKHSLGFNGNLDIPEEEIQSMAEAFLEHFSNKK